MRDEPVDTVTQWQVVGGVETISEALNSGVASLPSRQSLEEFISRKVAKLAKKPLAFLAALREAALEF